MPIGNNALLKNGRSLAVYGGGITILIPFVSHIAIDRHKLTIAVRDSIY